MKKLLAMATFCLITLFCLTSCFEEETGNPTPVEDTQSWSNTVKIEQNKEMKLAQTYVVNSDLAAHLTTQAVSITFDDIEYIKTALTYMGQYNLFVREETKYMETVHQTYKAIYNMYVGNLSINAVYDQIDEYKATYDALSDDCKENMTELNYEQLRAMAENVRAFSLSHLK